jgi:hypothetical protein
MLATPTSGEAASPISLAGQRPDKFSKVFSHTLCTCGADAARLERGYPIGVQKLFFAERCLHLTLDR